MLKKGIQNYFISLKHFFTPLGTMFLGIMIGVSILVPGIYAAFTDLINDIKNLGSTLNLDFTILWNTLWDKILALDWNMPSEALEVLFSKDWMNQTLYEILSTLLGTDFEVFQTQIAASIENFTSAIVAYCIVFFVWWILGYIAGYILIRFLIRRTIAKRGIWKYIVSIGFSSILSVAMVVLLAFLYLLWKPSIFISFVCILGITGMFSLLLSYLVYGRGIVKLKHIVNVKNIGLYLLTSLLIFLIALAFSLIAAAINTLLGIFVALSLFEIAFLVISMNADSYVKEMTNHAQIEIMDSF